MSAPSPWLKDWQVGLALAVVAQLKPSFHVSPTGLVAPGASLKTIASIRSTWDQPALGKGPLSFLR
jgi:hypothetical protein